MWPNIRSCASEVVATTALAIVLSVAPAARAASAPELPPAVLEIAPNLKFQGGGELTFFGFSIYDGWYWSPARGWPQEGPYALDLVYHRHLDGAKIAQRSVDEMAKLGHGTAADHARWKTQMAAIFPDVRKGDRITGVHTAMGDVRYFYNGRLIGAITDPDFAQAFFGIWLDPRSSRDDFRKKLLGEK